MFMEMHKFYIIIFFLLYDDLQQSLFRPWHNPAIWDNNSEV